MNVPADLKYASSHEWARLEGDVVTVGLSDHAQAELTDVVFLELPKVGRRVQTEESVAVIESVKAAHDIFAPIAGEIVEINVPLSEDPAPVNSDPYGEGWLFRIRIAPGTSLDHLLNAEQYRSEIS
ncbi:MAG: glycine cleavage system H protein [Verrucomicrobia bacterium]|jgi:glycine cleavage system H protein|nr:MAG: glycine cleavage system H protein [Verrucomicrobiota bacterium]